MQQINLEGSYIYHIQDEHNEETFLSDNFENFTEKEMRKEKIIKIK